MTDFRYETDAVIVGAGPVGLFAVFQLGMLKMRTHVVDALDAIGGQLTALYPEKPIYDIPGFPRILAADLVDRLAEQAEPFHPHFHMGVTVDSLVRLPAHETGGERWEVGLSDGRTVLAPVVIIAAGSGAFGPNRPPLAGLERFEGKSVFYYVKKREDYRGRSVVIAGGGDAAVDWAISLSEVAGKVTLVHRRPKFRAAPESEARLKKLSDAGVVELVVPYQLHALEGSEDGRLTGVAVSAMDGRIRVLEADRLLPFFGLAGDLGPIARWGLEMAGTQIAVAAGSQATNLPGVFAIGDVSSYPGKLKLILQGFAEAAQAAQSAYSVAFPGAALHFTHSTSSGLPTA